MAEEVEATTKCENCDCYSMEHLRTFGTVKWFNNKAGYGFITILDGEYKGKDIFIHHSGINIKGSHYKYLVQGEYVSCDVKNCRSEDESSRYEYQGINVCGVFDNRLMCEVQNENRSKNEKKN